MISAPLQGSDPKGPHLGTVGKHTWSEALGSLFLLQGTGSWMQTTPGCQRGSQHPVFSHTLQKGNLQGVLHRKCAFSA